MTEIASLLEKIKADEWTCHNIPLNDHGDLTVGAEHPIISQTVRVRLLKRDLPGFLWPKTDFSQLRALDLGCLEGGLAWELARMGFDTVGVEGRRGNYRKCVLIKDYFQHTTPDLKLDFLELDVRNLTPQIHGTFDVILCCGLLYHLPDPVVFLKLLSSMLNSGGVLFLDTPIAPLNYPTEGSPYHLSELETTPDGFQGRWANEDPTHPWSAIDAKPSFWLTHKSLVRALAKAGLSPVFDVHACFEDIDYEQKLRAQESRAYIFTRNIREQSF